MNCPKCGAKIKKGMDRCPKCGLGTLVTDNTKPVEVVPMRRILLRALFVFLGVLVTVCVVTFIGVRIHYNNENKRIEKKYDNRPRRADSQTDQGRL